MFEKCSIYRTYLSTVVATKINVTIIVFILKFIFGDFFDVYALKLDIFWTFSNIFEQKVAKQDFIVLIICVKKLVFKP